jgi:3-oxoacyl-[acyl-carrier protein] reductase
MVRAVRKLWRGIRANALAIGLTDTERGASLAEWGRRSPSGCSPDDRRPPRGRRVVCFLAGPDAAYITGKVLQVDGGQIIAG